MSSITSKEKKTVAGHKAHMLGKVQLRHQDTNEIILIPAPSDDPNDPLNWYVCA